MTELLKAIWLEGAFMGQLQVRNHEFFDRVSYARAIESNPTWWKLWVRR